MASLQILLFDVAGTRCGIRRDSVREVLPLPRLHRPPALPSPVAGFFNLGGTAVAVIRLELLFGLTTKIRDDSTSLYRHLLLVDDQEGRLLALLVDRVVDLAQADERRLSPVSETQSLNGCVEAEIDADGTLIHLLSLQKILLAEEREAIAALSQTAQARLDQWAVSD